MAINFTFSEKALLHSLHWYGFSPVCVLRCLLSNPSMRKPCYTDYIRMGFHQYVSLDVHQDDPQDYLSLRKTCYIGYIGMVFHQCVPLYVY